MSSTRCEAPHSSLRHLASAIWGNHDPERCHLAMFTAYFDASGKPHDKEVMFVSGFVSSEKKWLRFEEEWQTLLGDYRIKEPFHTTDYVAGRGSDYQSFVDDDQRRDEFEARAAQIIKRGIRKPVSTGLLLADYRQVIAKDRITADQSIDPYSFCAMTCVSSTIKWMVPKRIPEVEFVFEAGDDKMGKFMEIFRKVTGEFPIFRGKEKHPQFQAADILAWRHARLMKSHVAGRTERREFFVDVFRQLPHESCGFLDASDLRQLLDDGFSDGVPRTMPDPRPSTPDK